MIDSKEYKKLYDRFEIFDGLEVYLRDDLKNGIRYGDCVFSPSKKKGCWVKIKKVVHYWYKTNMFEIEGDSMNTYHKSMIDVEKTLLRKAIGD